MCAFGWTGPATLDLTAICDYIEEHNSGAVARRVALLIYEQVATLAEYPNRGRTGRKPATRELVVSGLPYLIVYRIRDSVEILRILHGAQSWP